MDWYAYKATCDQPDVLSRWMLEQTRELLAGSCADLARRLAEVLASQEPLVKPEDHSGGAETDMFRVGLSVVEARRIRDRVHALIRGRRETSGTRGRGLGGFGEAWDEFLGAMETKTQLDGDET